MAGERIRIERKTMQALYDLYQSGRVNLDPIYQRGKVWEDDKKKLLIDSIFQDYPIGLVTFNVIERPDDDGELLDYFEVVDGKQRLSTLFEYLMGIQPWTYSTKSKDSDFKPFKAHTASKQERIKNYEIAIAHLYRFDDDEITDVFSRLQMGKPLKIGEKLKALSSYSTYAIVKKVAEHDLFDVDSRYRKRADHWTLATSFLKGVYSKNPTARIEFQQQSDFIKTNHDLVQINKAYDECKRIMNYVRKVITEAKNIDPDCQFISIVGTARTLKWVFATIMTLFRTFNLTGKETAVARAIIGYYESIKVPRSEEMIQYLNTGRTGRMDTDEVKACLDEIATRIVNAAELSPIDTKRSFTPLQRQQIFDNSDSKCANCGVEISATNFHADHIKPHSRNGETEVSNGQALCAGCNTKKGNSWMKMD